MLPPSTQAAARWAKILLLAAIALFFTLVAFNNITDFDTNYQFVRHVLAMDTTFPDSHTTWRALRSPAIHVAFYLASSSGKPSPPSSDGPEPSPSSAPATTPPPPSPPPNAPEPSP